MPIDQECKKCGKTFRNKGYLYCSKDCQLADGGSFEFSDTIDYKRQVR